MIQNGWMAKNYKTPNRATTVSCLQETNFTSKDTHRWKAKGWRETFHTIEARSEQEWLYFQQTKALRERRYNDQEITSPVRHDHKNTYASIDASVVFI